MRYNDALIRGARQVLIAQVLLTLLLAAGFAVVIGWLGMLAALYGGMVTTLITGWLAWRLRRAGQIHDSAAGMAVIYSSWFLRYATVVVLLGVGLGYLKLLPLPVLVTFAITQLGFVASLRRA